MLPFCLGPALKATCRQCGQRVAPALARVSAYLIDCFGIFNFKLTNKLTNKLHEAYILEHFVTYFTKIDKNNKSNKH